MTPSLHTSLENWRSETAYKPKKQSSMTAPPVVMTPTMTTWNAGRTWPLCATSTGSADTDTRRSQPGHLPSFADFPPV